MSTEKNAYSEIHRCARCGFCQNSCPTYLHSRDEIQVARGRIHLVRLLNEGQYDLKNDKELMEKVNDCLLCGSCVANCPSSVRTDDIMRQARQDFLEARGLSLFHRLVYRGGLSHRERLDRASLLMRLYEKSGLRTILYGQVLRKALDKLIYFESFLPKRMETPARQSLPPVVRPSGTPKFKVGFFVGCASNVFAPATVKAAVEYLVSRGVEVHLPKVSCCGEPHRSAGDVKEMNRLASKNISAAFTPDYDFITTDCSTCAHALAQYDQFLPEGHADKKVLRLNRVMELNTLIVEHLGLEKDKLKPLPEVRVTYHDSCHALRGLSIKEAPRNILQKIPGLELVEMKEADSCCGGAGSYGFTHPEMAGKIASSKIKNVENTQAGVLALSCPACQLQLGAGLRRAGLDMAVRHPVELLLEASRS